MDPCKLVGIDKAQSVMGGQMWERVQVSYSDKGQAVSAGCAYQFLDLNAVPRIADIATRENLSISVSSETRAELPQSFRFFLEAGPLDKPTKPVEELGRETRYAFAQDSQLMTLRLVALSSKGAHMTLNLRMRSGDERQLLSKARSIAAPAVANIEKLFPGTWKPSREDPPIPICSIVGVAGMKEIYANIMTTPPGVSWITYEEEYFGGPSEEGSGPVGGGWICGAEWDSGPPTGPPEPVTAWWISKSSPSLEQTSGQSVRGLGAAAFWKAAGWWWGEPAGTLTVFTKEGRHLQVEVGLDQIGEDSGKRVATEVAKRILAQLL